MGFVLILVTLISPAEMEASTQGHFPLMSDCFEERELLIKQAKEHPQRQMRSVQAICVKAPANSDFALLQ